MKELTSLSNHFLIAMPTLSDPYFNHSVIYLCEHSEKGAVGIVINRPLDLNLTDVFEQMEISSVNLMANEIRVLCGGPVHPERGFVLHKPGGQWRSSLEMNSEICVTTSRDILEAIAKNEGPDHMVISLGYASWTPGQLEKEIKENAWLACPVSSDIVFSLPYEQRWHAALQLIGVNSVHLSSKIGHA